MEILFKGKPIKKGSKLFQAGVRYGRWHVSSEEVVSIGKRRFVVTGRTSGWSNHSSNYSGNTEDIEKELKNFFWTREEASRFVSDILAAKEESKRKELAEEIEKNLLAVKECLETVPDFLKIQASVLEDLKEKGEMFLRALQRAKQYESK